MPPNNEGEQPMPVLEVIGMPQSNFVRTVRMACVEKSVPYTLTQVMPHTPAINAINPFGKMPVMRHGDVALAETKAICTYIDLAFEGPRLIPPDPAGAAKTEQWVSMVTTGFDLVFARQYLVAYVFSGLPDGAPDRVRIDAAVPKVRDMFGILDRELGARPYLAGTEFTLADLFLLPLMYWLDKTPESNEMLAASPNVEAWFRRLSARPSAVETVPPPFPGRD
jgi:glutathione S-transferase